MQRSVEERVEEAFGEHKQGVALWGTCGPHQFRNKRRGRASETEDDCERPQTFNQLKLLHLLLAAKPNWYLHTA